MITWVHFVRQNPVLVLTHCLHSLSLVSLVLFCPFVSSSNITDSLKDKSWFNSSSTSTSSTSSRHTRKSRHSNSPGRHSKYKRSAHDDSDDSDIDFEDLMSQLDDELTPESGKTHSRTGFDSAESTPQKKEEPSRPKYSWETGGSSGFEFKGKTSQSYFDTEKDSKKEATTSSTSKMNPKTSAVSTKKDKDTTTKPKNEYAYSDDDWEDEYDDDFEDESMEQQQPSSLDLLSTPTSSGGYSASSKKTSPVPAIPLGQHNPNPSTSLSSAADENPRSGRKVEPVPSDGLPSPGGPPTPHQTSDELDVSAPQELQATPAVQSTVSTSIMSNATDMTTTSSNTLDLTTSTMNSTMETLKPLDQPLGPIDNGTPDSAKGPEASFANMPSVSASGQTNTSTTSTLSALSDTQESYLETLKPDESVQATRSPGAMSHGSEDDLFAARDRLLNQQKENKDDSIGTPVAKAGNHDNLNTTSGTVGTNDGRQDMAGRTLDLDFDNFGKQWQASHPPTPSSTAADKLIKETVGSRQNSPAKANEGEEEREEDKQQLLQPSTSTLSTATSTSSTSSSSPEESSSSDDNSSVDLEQRAREEHARKMEELRANMAVSVPQNNHLQTGDTPGSPDWFDLHLKNLRDSAIRAVDDDPNDEGRHGLRFSYDSQSNESKSSSTGKKKTSGSKKTVNSNSGSGSNLNKSTKSVKSTGSGSKTKKVGPNYKVSSRLYPGPKNKNKENGNGTANKKKGDALNKSTGGGKKTTHSRLKKPTPTKGNKASSQSKAPSKSIDSGKKSTETTRTGRTGSSNSKSKSKYVGNEYVFSDDDEDDSDSDISDISDISDMEDNATENRLAEEREKLRQEKHKQKQIRERHEKKLKELEENIDAALMEAQLSSLLAKQQQANATNVMMAAQNSVGEPDMSNAPQHMPPHMMNSVNSLRMSQSMDTTADWDNIRKEWTQVSMAKEEIKELEFEARHERLKYELERTQHDKKQAEEQFENKLAIKDKKMQEMKEEYEEKLKELRIAKAQLEKSARTNDQDMFKQRILRGENIEGIHQQEVEQIRKDLIDQERLIDGYQQENERLIAENHDLHEQLKELQRSQYDENERLIDQINRLQQQIMNKQSTEDKEHQQQVQQANGINGTMESQAEAGQLKQRLTEYEMEIQHLRKEMTNREEEFRYELDKVRSSARRSTMGMGMGMDGMGGMRSSSNANFMSMSMELESNAMLKKMQLEHQGVVDEYERQLKSLRTKIDWYVENQEILSRHELTIQQQKTTIRGLEAEISRLMKETSSSESKVSVDKNGRVVRRPTSKPADVKRIKELESQVHELEEVIRERNPNSIAALIHASKPSDEENVEVKYLQDRVEQLQEQLKLKNEEMEVKVRTLRQEYEKTKAMYEKRNEGISKMHANATKHKGGRVQELEQQVEDIRDHFNRKVRDLEAKLQTAERKEEEAQSKVKKLQQLAKSHASSQAGSVSSMSSKASERAERAEKELREWKSKFEGKEKEVEVIKAKLKAIKKNQQKGKEDDAMSAKSGLSGISGISTGADVKEAIAAIEVARGIQRDLELAGVNSDTVDLQRISFDLSNVEADGSVQSQVIEQLRNALQVALREVVQLKNTKGVLEEALKRAGEASQPSLLQQAAQESAEKSNETRVKHLERMLEMANMETGRLSALVKRYEDEQHSLFQQSPALREIEKLESRIQNMEIQHRKREAELEEVLTHNKVYSRIQLEKNKDEFAAFAAEKNREVQRFKNEVANIIGGLQKLREERDRQKQEIARLENIVERYQRLHGNGGRHGREKEKENVERERKTLELRRVNIGERK
eukprot:TRINITY_DN1769_c0_g1_i10.p1 TRINITY_DN1769_c0_g1~~TRINITY_DN1769_c0_g1_i10.p1  ORF type:complete len:1815 (+),score=696.04 TRINITY_DN1769_c0_g1_i10:4746-10190(+)